MPNIPMNTIKVCCFCERWESGGIESFLYNVLTRLDLSRIQVDIAAASLGKSVFTEPLRRRGVQFYELSGKQRGIAENHRLFAELMDAKGYDLVHLNIFHGLSLYYACLAERAGVPVRIAHSHNAALRRSAGKPLKLLLHNAAKRLFAGSAAELWACSASAAEFLFPKDTLREKGFRFIPNGIETDRFRFDPAAREEVRGELGLEHKFVIGNIGRLCYQKNQSFLLKVFAGLAERNPESRLLLVGEGEDRRRLEGQADKLGIADKVIFYGVSSHVERLLWAMDAFVFPSRFEGLGIAAIEAQAAGLPVLGSEHIPDEAHVTPLFQKLELNPDPAPWVEWLLRLDTARIGRSEGAAAVRKAGFDVASVAAEIENCYLRLAAP